jgi:maltose alpha-D-glucosyltransferase/alpha-amylase
VADPFQRGMRVLITLVVNHTPNEHPWFKEACRDPKSKYRDWYIWSARKPKNADSGVVFPGVQKSTWSYDKTAKAYYFHRFYDFQPDLNNANPDVQAEILKIMDFWLQLGVSGFRMDAVPFVIAKKGAGLTRPSEQYDMLRAFSEFLTWRKGEAIILAEANVLPDTDLKYFGDSGERLQMMFNFEVNQHLFFALASSDSRPLAKAINDTKPRPRRHSGDSSFATTMSWTSGVSTRSSAQPSSRHSVPTRTCNCISAGFDDGSLPYCKEIAGVWNSSTA